MLLMGTVIVERPSLGGQKMCLWQKTWCRIGFAVQHNQSSAKVSTGAPLSNLMLLRCTAHNVLLS